MPSLRNATGRLTRYAFACGYVEKREKGADRVSLSMEHNTYHIKGMIGGIRVWETARTLTEARKLFAREAKKLASAT